MSTVKSRVRRSAVIAVAGAALATALAGCAMSDDQMARFLVAPNKYAIYNCDEIARQLQITGAREKELQQLMARASTDAGGRLASSLAYDSDYLTARGELNELRATAVAKHCDPVPGTAGPAARASDSAIR
jgi:hypothetical protein